MVNVNNNFNVIPWYSSLEQQNHRKWYAFDKQWPLIMPNTRFLPFQFVLETTPTNISAITVYSEDKSITRNLGIAPIAVPNAEKGYCVVMLHPEICDFTAALPEGRYYATLTIDGETLYSEVFTVVGNISSYLKLTYWNTDTLYYKNGEINYANDFRYEMYLDTTIGKPEYEFSEELTTRLGYKFLESQISNKLYKFVFLGPEFICDAMRLIRLSDYIKLESGRDSYNAISFSYEPSWETQGDLASIEVSFETDTIIQKLPSFNRNQRENFYNALLSSASEPLLYDEGVVAQYYTAFSDAITGKLTRQLAEANVEEITKSTMIPIDQGLGAAQRVSLLALFERYGGSENAYVSELKTTVSNHISNQDIHLVAGERKKLTALLSFFRFDETNNAVVTPFNFISEGTIGMGDLGDGGNTPGAMPSISIQVGDSEPVYPNANGLITLPPYPEVGLDESALAQYLTTNQYAKLSDIPSLDGYALASDLTALRTDFDNLNTLLNGNVGGIIDTWNEVVSFLDGYSQSDDLATILSGMNSDIANRVLTEDFEKLEDSVSGIAGYFTNGSANNALKLGGQLPSYYATADALNSVSNRVQKFEDIIDIDKNGDVYIKGTRNFYTEGGTIGMAGLGSGGSGGGGAAGIVTIRVNGEDYSSTNGLVILPDYPSLSGYATELWVLGKGYLTSHQDISHLLSKIDAANTYQPKGNYLTAIPNEYITESELANEGFLKSVSWTDVKGRPTKVSEFTNDKNYITDTQASSTYATIIALEGVNTSVNTLRTEFDALNTLLNDDTSGKIDTWNEVVAFLNGYAESTDLATILAEMNADISKRAFQTDLNTAVNRIAVIENNYVDKSSIQTITGVKTFSNGLKIGDAELVWDDTNKALKIIGSAYVTEAFSMGKITESGGGGGGAAGVVTVRVNGIDYSSVNGIVTLPDYPAIPTSLKSPYALTFGSKTYDGSAAKTITASDLGALTAHQDISHLLSKTDASNIYQPKGDYLTSVAWEDVSGKPSFATVATSGQYSDLSGTPSSLPASDVYAWAKAASKPSYAFSEITGKPTLLSGYGITDFVVENTSSLNNTTAKAGIYRLSSTAPDNHGYGNAITLRHLSADTFGQLYISYNMNIPKGGVHWRGATNDNTTQSWRLMLDESNYSSYALPLSGGELQGTTDTPLYLNGTDGSYIGFRNSAKSILGYFGFDGTQTPKVHIGYNYQYALIHSGNIGSQSVSYANSAARLDTTWCEDCNYTATSNLKIIANVSGVNGNYPTGYVSGLSVMSSYVGWQLVSYGGDIENPYFRSYQDNGTWKPWRQLAFLTDNVASATKLQTARTIWGQLFDGTQNVSGVLSDVNQVTLDANKTYGIFRGDWYDGNLVRDDLAFYAPRSVFSGNVLIGGTSDNGAKLQVNGGVTTYGSINLQSVGEIQNALSISRYDNGTGYYVGSRNAGLGVTDGGCLIYTYGSTPISFYTYGSERMKINGSSGNVSIYGNLVATGTIAMGTLSSSSDARLKYNIEHLTDDESLAVLRQLRPSKWNWKSNGALSYGFIAQDVEKIASCMVDRMNDEELGQKLYLQYNQLHAFEVGAIQHIDSEVEQLKKDLKTANTKIEKLENELKQYRLCQ